MIDLRESMRRAAESVDPLQDLDDVFRRAKRRPMVARYVAVGLVVAAIAAGVVVPTLVASRRGVSPAGGGQTTSTVTSTLPPGHERLQLLGTYAQSGSLFAAGGGAFFSTTPPQSCGEPAGLTAITDSGSVTEGRLTDPLACYASAMAADASSLYLGTSVIAKFSSASNELLRLDPVTLAVLGRRDIPGQVVTLVAGPQGLLVATPIQVLLLDPTTLATLATYSIPGAVAPPVGSAMISSLAAGQDAVWLTYGTAESSTLYRLDPSTLALLGTTPAGSGQGLRVTADAEETWLTGGDSAWPVAASGTLGPAVHLPGLQTAVAVGDGLVALEGVGSAESLVVVNTAAAVVATARAADAGAVLAEDDGNVWVPCTILALRGGSIQQEDGVAHFVIVPPSS